MANCSCCRKEFGLFRWKYKCCVCYNLVCTDCANKLDIDEDEVNLFYILNIIKYYNPDFWSGKLYVCQHCMAEFHQNTLKIIGYDSVHTISHNYKGRLPRYNACQNISSNWHRYRSEAEEELKKIARFYGYTQIIKMKFDKDTDAENSENGKGTHYFTVWKASGLAIK